MELIKGGAAPAGGNQEEEDTMACTWTRLLCTPPPPLLLLLLLTGTGRAQDTAPGPGSEEELSPRGLRDFYQKGPNLTSEKQLLGALQEVLEKLQERKLPSWEKKFGQVPTCDVGEQCAVRKGARIGKMCDCPRGAFCNFYLLKCL